MIGAWADVKLAQRPHFRLVSGLRVGVNYLSTVQHTVPGLQRLCVFTIVLGKVDHIYLTDVLDHEIGGLKERALLQYLLDNPNRATLIHRCEHA